MNDSLATLLPRHAQRALEAHLGVMPAVVLTGARQTGKSTLAQRLVAGERRFVSLDDLDALDLARRDPDA
ncbi:MAG TPA: ATP-binding protein, partial [Actinomycetota bacterium]|nr:ATP-binding protein [Actinomycetota bacterium]